MQRIEGEKGQMYTLEALAAAIIMILALSIVVEITSITPLSSSFTNQHIKLELQNIGNDILRTLDETPAMNNTTGMSRTNVAIPSLLKRSVIDWMVFSRYDTYTWDGTNFASQNNGSIKQLNTSLSNALKFALTDNCIAYNVEVNYQNVTESSSNIYTSKMIWNGDPSENSVTVSRFIVLHNNLNEVPVDAWFDNYKIMPDIGGGTNIHSVAEVRLTLWVM